MQIFPEFAPDRAIYDPTVMSVMENAFPRANSYSPVPSFAPIASPLPSPCRGYAIVRAQDDSFIAYAGTATHLYRYNQGTASWDDVSGPSAPYNLGDADTWSFAQFADELIATNVNDPVQKLDLGGGVFSDLGGNPPRAKYALVSGEFLHLLDIAGPGEGMAWSGRNRTDWWTNGKYSSGEQIFRDGGEITGGSAGQNGGVILQKDAIRRMTFMPSSPYTFSFTKLDFDRGRGCISPGSVVTVNSSVFFLDENGFFQYTSGGGMVPIGEERVDEFIRSDARDTRYVLGTADIGTKSIYWRYQSKDGPAVTNFYETDTILGYSWAINRWFLVKIKLTWLANAATVGYTLDGLDATGFNLDTLPFSLDSAVWKGGDPVVAGIDQNNALGYFQGPSMQALLETADTELNPGRRTMVQGFRIYSDTAEAQGQVGTKEFLGQATRWRPLTAQSKREGSIKQRASGRVHKARVIIPAGAEWSHVSAIEFSASKDAGS